MKNNWDLIHLSCICKFHESVIGKVRKGHRYDLDGRRPSARKYTGFTAPTRLIYHGTGSIRTATSCS